MYAYVYAHRYNIYQFPLRFTCVLAFEGSRYDGTLSLEVRFNTVKYGIILTAFLLYIPFSSFFLPLLLRRFPSPLHFSPYFSFSCHSHPLLFSLPSFYPLLPSSSPRFCVSIVFELDLPSLLLTFLFSFLHLPFTSLIQFLIHYHTFLLSFIISYTLLTLSSSHPVLTSSHSLLNAFELYPLSSSFPSVNHSFSSPSLLILFSFPPIFFSFSPLISPSISHFLPILSYFPSHFLSFITHPHLSSPPHILLFSHPFSL